MKRPISFIKTTALGGLLVIVPIAIIVFVLGQLLLTLFTLASGVTAYLDIGIDDALVIFAIALLSLVGLCFATGLFVRTRLGDAAKRWFGRNVASRIPMYHALANLTRRFAGVDGPQFAPVEVDLYGSGAHSMGFLVEELPESRSAVFVPTAPVATVGNLYIVPNDRIRRIEASMADTVSVITQWGVDSGNLFGNKQASGPVGDDAA